MRQSHAKTRTPAAIDLLWHLLMLKRISNSKQKSDIQDIKNAIAPIRKQGTAL